MLCKFFAYGHPNILGTHKTTLEFTKDREISLKGDCIVGVKADFDFKKLRKFIKKCKSNKIKIIISKKLKNKKISETINAEINPEFNSNKELVIRKTGFVSERTFAINADKAAFDLDRSLTKLLKERGSKIDVTIE